MRVFVVLALAGSGCVVSEGVGDPFATDGLRPGVAVPEVSPWASAAPRGLTMAARLPLQVDDLVLQSDGFLGHAVMEAPAVLDGDGVYTCAFATVTGEVTDDKDLSDPGGIETIGDAGVFLGEDTTISITDEAVQFLSHAGDGHFRVEAGLPLGQVAGVGLWDGGWVGLRHDGYGGCLVERYLETATEPAEVHRLDGTCEARPDVEVDADGRAWFVHQGQIYGWSSGAAPAPIAAGRSVAWTPGGVAIADGAGVRVLDGPATPVSGEVRRVLAVGGLQAYLAIGGRLDGTGVVWLIDARSGQVVDEMFVPDVRAPMAAARDVGLFAIGGDDVTLVQVGL